MVSTGCCDGVASEVSVFFPEYSEWIGGVVSGWG